MINKIKILLLMAVFVLIMPSNIFAEEGCPSPVPQVKGISKGFTEDELGIYIMWTVDKSLIEANNIVNFGYKISKKGPGGEIIIGTISPDEVSADSTDKYTGFYNDPMVALEETYTYSVSLFDTLGNEYSAGTVTVKAELEKYEEEKECVAEIKVYGDADENQNVNLNWNKVCGADEYKIFRDGNQTGTTEEETTDFIDQNVSEGKHTYKVEAWGPKTSSFNNSDKKIISVAKAADPDKDKKTEGETKITVKKKNNGGETGGGVFGGDNLDSWIKNFYTWTLGIGSLLAILILMYAGYLLTTSRGHPEQVNLAKEYIIGALSGLAFLLLAAVIYDAIKVDSNTSNTTNPVTIPTPNDNPYQVPPDEIPQEPQA
jgi:hypothetical protein